RTGLRKPSAGLLAVARASPTSARKPDHCGAAMLVPPIEVGKGKPNISTMHSWPDDGLALNATSGYERFGYAVLSRPDCHAGSSPSVLTPPPPPPAEPVPLHAVSERLEALVSSVVPPTATTSGRAAGQSGIGSVYWLGWPLLSTLVGQAEPESPEAT